MQIFHSSSNFHFIYLIISPWIHKYLLLIYSANCYPITNIIHSVTQVVSGLVFHCILSACLYPLAFIIFQHFFSFWHRNMFQAQFILALHQSALESAVSPRSSGSFKRRMYFRNHELDTSCAHCYQGISAPQALSVDRAGACNLHTHPHTYMHKFSTFTSVFLYLNVLKTMSSRLAFINYGIYLL